MRLLALCLGCWTAAPVAAQTLGTVDFPNSGRAAAQAPFLTGILLLHSFEYEDAAAAFRKAQAADPAFAMAYWGEAMTFTHPLWNQQDTAAARAVLLRLGATPEARRATAPTAREQGYLDALEQLYAPDLPKARRDTLFSRALERLAAAYPGDDEALAFHALWLMGLSQGSRQVPTYMRAGAIAEEIYRRHPQHPGALHYIIHAFDDPVHAPLGLHAAREYAGIAPDADHAQHMTTHIFLALGMWPETVRQNAVAAGPDSSRWRPGHYTAWHNYALLQLGRFDAARALLEILRGNQPSPARPGSQGYLLATRAHYLVNSERWTDDIADWELDTSVAPIGPRAMDAYAAGLTALRRGRRPDAARALARIERLARTPEADNSYGAAPALPALLALHLRAELAAAGGDQTRAISLLRQAAALADTLPAEYGPPDILKPAHERLGELLLETGQAAAAQREFARALALAPGRARALLGLARAARAGGDTAVARRALTTLEAQWREADAALPELAELSTLRAAP